MDENHQEIIQEGSFVSSNAESEKGSEEAASLSSSSSSSPLPVDELGPLFEIKGIRATTDSSVLSFRVTRLDDPENRASYWEVTRTYEEFETFNRLLLDSQKFGGTIFPPLPPPINTKFDDSLAEAPIIHRKQVERCNYQLFLIMSRIFTD